MFLIKQISEWTRFVKLKISQTFYSFILSELKLLISMLKSPISIRFSYFHKTLQITSFMYSKNVLKFAADGGLYILKETHFFFEILNSEKIHSLQLGFYSLTHLQIKPCLTNSIRPPPCLCLSLLVLNSYPLDVHWTFS